MRRRLRLPHKRIVTTQSPPGLKWRCPNCPNEDLMMNAVRQWCLLCGWSERRPS